MQSTGLCTAVAIACDMSKGCSNSNPCACTVTTSLIPQLLSGQSSNSNGNSNSNGSPVVVTQTTSTMVTTAQTTSTTKDNKMAIQSAPGASTNIGVTVPAVVIANLVNKAAGSSGSNSGSNSGTTGSSTGSIGSSSGTSGSNTGSSSGSSGSNSDNGGVVVVGMSYSANPHTSSDSTQNVSSSVLSLNLMNSSTMEILPATNLSTGINITFPITADMLNYITYVKANPSKFPSQNLVAILGPVVQCRYCNTTTTTWEIDGLNTLHINDTTITCYTAHLTDFGIQFNNIPYGNLTDVPITNNQEWSALLDSNSASGNVGLYVVIISFVLYVIFGIIAILVDRKLSQMSGEMYTMVIEAKEILSALLWSSPMYNQVEAKSPKSDPSTDRLANAKVIVVDAETPLPAQMDSETPIATPALPQPPIDEQIAHSANNETAIPPAHPGFWTLFLMFQPIASIITQSYTLSTRIRRLTLYLVSVMIHFLFACVFFAPISSTRQEQSGGQIFGKGLASAIVNIVIMFALTYFIKFPKETLGQLVMADKNELASTVVPNAERQLKMRQVYGYVASFVLVTCAYAFILAFCAQFNTIQARNYGEIVVVSWIMDQIAFELLAVMITHVVLKVSKSSNGAKQGTTLGVAKKILHAKYGRAMLIG